MANRRMFSIRITSSGRFLKMPQTSQALYFHLCMNADDDGVVEAFKIMRMGGFGEDDLKVISAKGLVEVLNEDLVTLISDWNEHNLIRADRKIDSIYKELLVKVVPEVKLIEPKPRADTGKITGGQAMDVQRTGNGQHRLGKDRIGKDRKEILISKDIREAKLHNKEKIDFVLEEFKKHWGFFPTDHYQKPRYVAFNLVRKLEGIRKRKGKEITLDNTKKLIKYYMNWARQEDWSENIQKLETLSSKIPLFIAQEQL